MFKKHGTGNPCPCKSGNLKHSFQLFLYTLLRETALENCIQIRGPCQGSVSLKKSILVVGTRSTTFHVWNEHIKLTMSKNNPPLPDAATLNYCGHLIRLFEKIYNYACVRDDLCFETWYICRLQTNIFLRHWCICVPIVQKFYLICLPWVKHSVALFHKSLQVWRCDNLYYSEVMLKLQQT